MSWQDFVTEFRTMYYNREILTAQQDEFNSMRQGSMTVLEAVKKFEQLARLCSELVPNEMEKVRRMIKMFRTDIAQQVSAGSSPPTLVANCISRAIRVKYWINQDKEVRAQIYKVKKEEKAVLKQSRPKQIQEFHLKGQTSNSVQNSKQFRRNKRKGNASNQGQQRNYPQKKNIQGNGGNNYPVYVKCGKKHFGVCRIGTNACYLYGKKGHYARNCTSNNQNQNQQYLNRNSSNQLHVVQAKIEGPSIAQGRLEAHEPQARIYAYTKGDVELGTSNVVTGQIYIATYDAIALFDFGATYSFVSKEFAHKLGREAVKLDQPFRTSIPSGEILLSDYWVRNILVVIGGRELYTDIVGIKL